MTLVFFLSWLANPQLAVRDFPLLPWTPPPLSWPLSWTPPPIFGTSGLASKAVTSVTGIGDSRIWHGFPDALVNSVTICSWDDKTDSELEYHSGFEHTSDSEDMDSENRMVCSVTTVEAKKKMTDHFYVNWLHNVSYSHSNTGIVSQRISTLFPQLSWSALAICHRWEHELCKNNEISCMTVSLVSP